MSNPPSFPHSNPFGISTIVRLAFLVLEFPTEIGDKILAYSLIREPECFRIRSGLKTISLAHCSIGRLKNAFPHPITLLPELSALRDRVEFVYREENSWTFHANPIHYFYGDRFEQYLWCPRTQLSELRLMKNVTIELDFRGCIHYERPTVDRARAIRVDEKVQLMRDNVIQICNVLSKAERIPVVHLTLKDMTMTDDDSLLYPGLWHAFM